MNGSYHLENAHFQNPLFFDGVYLHQIGRRFCPANSGVPEHAQSLFELTVVTDGGGKILTNGQTTEVKANDIYLSLPGDTHELRAAADEPLKFDFFAFSCTLPEFNSDLELIAQTHHSPNKRVFRADRVRQLVDDAIAELNREHTYSSELVGMIFRQIIIYIIRAFQNVEPDNQRDTANSAEVLCYQMMNYIDTHIYSMRNLNELASALGYSYGYLSALFKKTANLTLSHYYLDKKMNMARLLITEGRYSMTAIAEMLNYNSVYAFSKAFSSHFGMSPREYRKYQIIKTTLNNDE